MFVLASYPVHFHMALDVDADGENPFVRSNSIRDSFSRCVTVHGTSGVHVEDNVAVDHFGHCYFLGTKLRIITHQKSFRHFCTGLGNILIPALATERNHNYRVIHQL